MPSTRTVRGPAPAPTRASAPRAVDPELGPALHDTLTDPLVAPAQRVASAPIQRAPSPAGDYYHATTANAWMNIQKTGLDPNYGGNGKGWSVNESELSDSRGKVFFNRSRKNAKETAKQLAERPDSGGAVVLKFSAEEGELQSGDTMGGDWTDELVSGGRLEVVDSFEQRVASASASKSRKCFLTTACCEARGLPDDCRELTTLRGFRDGVLLATAEGRALVEAYYRVAPALVDAIRADPAGPAVLDGIYADVVACCAHVEAGRSAEAVTTYTAMVEALRRRYEEEAVAA